MMGLGDVITCCILLATPFVISLVVGAILERRDQIRHPGRRQGDKLEQYLREDDKCKP